MKKQILTLCGILFASFAITAQVQTPQPSPSAKIEQRVGLTDITLEYSRPAMRGRTIMGDLIPYGEVWRTGANENTKITFSDDVKIGGKALKKGTYAVYTVPNASSWDVIFYSDANNWGNPEKWDDSKVALKTTVSTESLPFDIESFTILFGDITNNSAMLDILWERTYVGVKIEVPTEKKAMASIEDALNGPSARDYFSSAMYYFQEGKDIKKAKEWVDKAVGMQEEGKVPFWMLRQKALIYHKAGDKKGAIKAAKQSLAAAEEANNPDYVKMNKDSLKEWGAM
ncbi:DUF2911 domain-containing protein [Sinomicrobium weinanense]|uniref:DUF2911 domain-containing protein n=1 Tax=Sinomicrobium weinanense TaxID=2842200 RepID=A0A926JT75_9FLAO|nr:DUF2911 domain-containing protein [Sinomicrobium weinanense]MBC9797087.1 DUF2911 domain-containing protein [Sinomicrobium weinanense]MBU3122684.1 DUF2911 domain-containing protein [Sinomicrobium weinanense]